MRNVALLFLLITFPSISFCQINNPAASPSSIINFGNARFTILTPQLVRMEYSAKKEFEDKASLVFINRHLPTPPFTSRQSGSTITIQTKEITLAFINDGKPFNNENLSVQLKNGMYSTQWKPGMRDTGNLKGTMRTLDQVNGWEGEKNLENGLLSRSGWVLVDDSKSPLFNGDKVWNWVIDRTDTTAIDLYLFAYGNEYKKALLDYTKVAGKIPMPPKYAFGYWWSRYWIYNDAEFRNLVTNFKSMNIPMDVLIIDMDWHETYNFSGLNVKTDPEGQMLGWTGYTWNKSLFPDPPQFFKWTEKEGLKTALNLHPASGVPPMEEKYGAFAAKFGFDTTQKKYIPFDMSNKKWAQTYFNVLLKPMEKMGVDFWWLDWQQYLMDKNIKNLTNTWWLNYTFFTNMENEGEKRPFLFHRWGGLGNHRYQIGFSGDAHTNWETLDFETYFTATASNVGYGYWSHDIGGHIFDGPTDGEMYLRWLQFGVLSPILRTHSSKISEIERRIWKFPNQFLAMREAIKLRYTLAPYIYNAAREAYDSGVSICRPMYYNYPDNEEAYNYKTQYNFGNDIIAAPITSAASKENYLAQRKFWLPEGQWLEYSTGALLKGNTSYDRQYTQEEIPMFLKEGSIIPLNPEMKNLQEQPSKNVLLFVPGLNKGQVTLYEDDGHTDSYKKGGVSYRKITRENDSDKKIKIQIEPQTGTYKGQVTQQAFELRLPNTIAPVQVIVDGKQYPFVADGRPGTWSYSNTDLATIINIPKTSIRKKIEIVLSFDKPLQDQYNVLNGNKGFLARMATVTEKLKFIVAEKDWGGTLPNSVYEAANGTNIILYHPEKVYELLKKFNASKADLKNVLLAIPYVAKDRIVPLVEYLELK